jgi:tetratricopeptide (TPR) repeat protein
MKPKSGVLLLISACLLVTFTGYVRTIDNQISNLDQQALVNAKIEQVQWQMKKIATALECYFVDNDQYPKLNLNYNVPNCITTPIAYIANFPPNPFSPDPIAPYKYYQYSLTSEDTTKKPDYGYVLVSEGPDQKLELTYDRLTNALNEIKYQPSINVLLAPYSYKSYRGVYSSGDLIRTSRGGYINNNINTRNSESSSAKISDYSNSSSSFEASLSGRDRARYLELVTRATTISENGLSALWDLSNLYKQYRQIDKCEDVYDKLIAMAHQIMQNSSDKVLISQAYTYQAMVFRNRKQYDKGVQSLDEYFQKYPYGPQYLALKRDLIEFLAEQQNYTRALHECDLLINNFPRCSISAESYAHYDTKMISDLESHGKVEGLQAKAQVYTKMGDNKAAIKCYQDMIPVLSTGIWTTSVWATSKDVLLKEIQSETTKLSAPTPHKTEIPDYTGFYYGFGGELIEIQRNPDSTLTINDGNNPRKGEQQGNRILCFYNQETGIFIVEPDGKTLGMVDPRKGRIIPNVAWKVDDPLLLTALQNYKDHKYSSAERDFKIYLKSHPNDSLIQFHLVESLLEQDKLAETKLELANFEKLREKELESTEVNKSRGKEPELFYRMMVPRVKYKLTGKEKSLAHENAFDDYRELIDAFKYDLPPIKEATVRNILTKHPPLAEPDKQMVLAYLSPNLDVIQKFLVLPEKENCYITDSKYSAKLMSLPRSVIYYGELRAKEGNLNLVVESYHRAIRFGQQISSDGYMAKITGQAIRSMGITGFEMLYTDGQIKTVSDAQFVFDTLKGLRRFEPVITKDNIFEMEPRGYYDTWDEPGSPIPDALIRAHIPETKLILLETAAALKLYQLQNKTYPAMIQDLVPKYLAQVPVDTFSNNPIKFIPSSQGIIVYSIGPDNTDDKGQIIYDQFKGVRSKGDLAITIK